ncbi:MAG: PQQ-binding-like beta-propeller repeat protein [Lacipirellulaceae bacterium]
MGQASWPEFRGPGGQGVVAETAPLVWSEGENVAWRTAIPGRGWSSPVVEGDRVWMTTAIEEAATAEEAEAKIQGGTTDAALAKRLSLLAVSVDRVTGKTADEVKLFEVDSPDAIHSLNSYASPTPVIEAGRLYCWFGTYGTCALDVASGDVLWRSREELEHYVGPGSSPVLWRDLLVLTCDGADKQYVTALRKSTGERLWKTERPPLRATDPDVRKSYSTPLVISVAGEQQLVVPGAEWLVAYDPSTGKELWRVNHGNGFSVVPRPVERDGVLYYASGFADDKVIAVRTDGKGDVTATHVVWRAKRQTPHMASPLLVDQTLVTVSDQGIGVGLDLATGKQLWRKRIGGGQSASPMLSAGRVYFFGHDGKTTVLDAAAPEGAPLAVNQLDGRIMATPAVVDGQLLLRTDKALYSIGQQSR